MTSFFEDAVSIGSDINDTVSQFNSDITNLNDDLSKFQTDGQASHHLPSAIHCDGHRSCRIGQHKRVAKWIHGQLESFFEGVAMRLIDA